MSVAAVPAPDQNDEELLRLAEAAVANPTNVTPPVVPGAPAAPAVPAEPAPGVLPPPAEEGPTELPGDRDMNTVAAPGSAAARQSADAMPAPPANLPGADALVAARQSDLAVADAKGAESQPRTDESNANAEAIDRQSDQDRANAAEIQAEQLATEEGHAEASRIADEAESQYKNFQFHDWWTQHRDPDGSYREKTLGEKIKAAIFVGLGDVFKGPGEENQSLKRIDGWIKQWEQRDRQEIAQKYNFAKLKSEGVDQFMAGRKQDMAVMQLRHAALTNAVADEMRAQLIRNKVPVQEAENNTMVLKTRADADAKYAKGLADLIHQKATEAMARAHLALARAQVEAKPPTEAEGNNAARGRNMGLAADNLEKSGLTDYQPSDAATQKWLLNQEQIEGAKENNKGSLGQVVNGVRRAASDLPVVGKKVGIPTNEFEGLSDKDKQYFSLMRQVIEPYARKQSGAAISASEWQNFATQTGLGTGEFGKQLREQAARDMQVLGGKATRQLEASDRARGAATPGSASINKTPTSAAAPSEEYVARARQVLADSSKYSKEDLAKAAQILDADRKARK